METTKLRGLLEELHGELEKAESVEPETRALLASVMDDIHGVLGKSESPEAHGDESISQRLREAVVDFENSHPRLSFAVERLMKSLSDIGI